MFSSSVLNRPSKDQFSYLLALTLPAIFCQRRKTVSKELVFVKLENKSFIVARVIFICNANMLMGNRNALFWRKFIRTLILIQPHVL